MPWIQLRFKKTTALLMTVCLVALSAFPGIAVACEGATEEQKISIEPVEWGKGIEAKKEKCPENVAKTRVKFTETTQWCEYEVKNRNVKEKVKIEEDKLGFNEKCIFGGGVFCLAFRESHTVPECEEGKTELAAGKACYDRIEYVKKPAAKEEETGFFVKTKSEGGVKKTTEVNQIVE